jgi:hypothetical protein
MAASNNTINWIIVFFHQVAYGSKSDVSGPLTDLSSIFHPLFEIYDVDLVLQANSLFYDRTFPIRFGNNFSMPIVTDYNRSLYESPDGQIFANIGTAGHAIFDFQDKPNYIAAQNSSYGFLETEISSDVLNATYITNDGIMADNFMINKTKQAVVDACSSLDVSTMRLSSFKC